MKYYVDTSIWRARDNNAIVVTRDKHFDKLRKIVPIKKPEEII